MFDVGFSELCLIGLVSLLVIGPERLPKVARLTGYWLGKTRSMVAAVKEEIKLELEAEELRQIFKEQSGLEDVQQMFDQATDAFKSTIDRLPTTSKAQNDLNTGALTEEQHKGSLPTANTEQHEPK
jgi:sec-independent protein translocase protein TatB